MKKLILLFACSLLALGGCSEPEAETAPAAEKPTVGVRFSLKARIDTDTSLEPMTRVTEYRNVIFNQGLALLLKKQDGRWIVDCADTIYLDGKPSRWGNDMYLTENSLSPVDFSVELRPGEYRIVALLNWRSATTNKALIPGTVVADENDPTLRTPPFITYTVITGEYINAGYRMLNREVYVAVADFLVPKSSDLHDSAMPSVPLQAERRVGKLRTMVKEHTSPDGFLFAPTPHTFELTLTPLDGPFAEGIDAMGNMYYSEEGLWVLPWCTTTVDFHDLNGERYQLCQSNSTAFSPFLFVDPAREQRFEISDIRVSGASGGYNYKTDQVISRTLAASRMTGIVFQTTDEHDLPAKPFLIHLVEATDANGNWIDAADLFDPFFEWNAASED
ncbi:hypothetical protein [Alistipes sp.]|uniref:hypothetical protein n=1 Tax=Alistipes sp. TaxID=1872444 RepID=UPI003AF14581